MKTFFLFVFFSFSLFFSKNTEGNSISLYVTDFEHLLHLNEDLSFHSEYYCFWFYYWLIILLIIIIITCLQTSFFYKPCSIVHCLELCVTLPDIGQYAVQLWRKVGPEPTLSNLLILINL